MKVRSLLRFRSFSADLHGWRGVSWGKDLVNAFLVLGIVTFWVSQVRVSDSIKELKDALDKLRGGKS